MRKVLFLGVLAISSLSACSLYFDEDGEHKGKLEGSPDAGFDHDGGGAPDGCSDGGIEDGGAWPDAYHPDGGAWPDAYVPDGGAWPDAYLPDGGIVDGGPADGGGAPD